MNMWIRFAVVLGFLGASAIAHAQPVIGKAAPDFSAQGADGKTYKLADYKGKYVVLEWFNNGCPFVRKHYESGNMQKLQETYAGKGAVWLTIISSAKGKEGHLAPEGVSQVRSEWNIKSVATLLDSDGKIGRKYAAKTTPHMYVINPEGALVYMGAIDSKNSADQADIPSSTNYVAAALDEAMAGKPVSMASTKPYGCSVKY